MDRILAVIVSALFYGSSSFAADVDRVSEGFQYSLPGLYVDGFDGSKATAWKGEYEQPGNENGPSEERSLDYSQDRKVTAEGTTMGLGVAPFYDSHGVFRTSSSDHKPTYFAVGFVIDELAEDEAGNSKRYDDGLFSYGFGIKNSSYNIEYMMSLDEENYELSAISLGFSSEF